jgi:hypothetical protein
MPKALLTDRYASKIRGVLSCFDRIVLTGTLPEISHPEGMTGHLAGKGIRVFDYAAWAKPFNEEIRARAEELAQENGLTVDYIAKPRRFRKEERIKAIVEKRGSHPGLVHIFSVIESCTEFRPWHDKAQRQDVPAPEGIEVPPLLLLLHRPRAGTVLLPHPHLGAFPPSVLLQWTRTAGGQAETPGDRLRSERQRFRQHRRLVESPETGRRLESRAAAPPA